MRLSTFIFALACCYHFAQSQDSCLFNTTHCACTVASVTGLCSRFSSGVDAAATCVVDNCLPNSYVCDCAGPDICDVRSCNAWVPDNPADVTSVGDIIPCTYVVDAVHCLSPISSSPSPSVSAFATPSGSPVPSSSSSSAPSASALPSSMASTSATPSVTSTPLPSSSNSPAMPSPSSSSTPTPSPSYSPTNSPSYSPTNSPSYSPTNSPSYSPTNSPSYSPTNSPSYSPTSSPSYSPTPSAAGEYRMVQVGAASDANMFNMSAFTDPSDFITTTFNMRNGWPYPHLLEHRMYTVMFYVNEAGDTHFLCVIMNTYTAGDDFRGTQATDVTVTGVNGQTLNYVACDDVTDCPVTSGVTISSFFGNFGYQTDGFCVAPIENDGNSVTISLTGIQRARGIRFLSPGDITEKEYMFVDGPGNGLTGTVDSTGLVTNGEIPIITFNLNGLLVP